MTAQSFYEQGLRFSCTRCSCCCRHESGFVYLSENDLSRLAKELEMEYTPFIETWCRWVPFEQGMERLSLKEKASFDCIFWKSPPAEADASTGGVGCTIYNARPLQCRSFPFWDSVVCSPQAWKTAGKSCPGIDSGNLHTREEIDGFLKRMEEELVIERKALRIGGMDK